ncbi:MAG: DUF2851 family protein [Cyclobacteriaceae bacterium]|nr:DUF2851 family protein [Cyclobacteriaceae bacterium]
MNESFLHYLWQFQYFDKKDLKTTAGESISIRKQGMLNSDAGPDFYQASIVIDGIEWAGTVEVHVNSSAWYAHQHDSDKAYDNVILHLVWEEDKRVMREDGTRLPTLALKGRVDENLLNEYRKLIHSASVIPCEKSFINIDNHIKVSMVERALMQRLESKAKQVIKALDHNKGDWEETTYQLFAAGFGFKVNKEPFAQLARALPYKIIQKNVNNLLQVEALLFGQAGMLPTKSKDEYITGLFKEFNFLEKKYSLAQAQLNLSQWKFLRLRPANFPTLRIAQFAGFLSANKNLFSQCIEAQDTNALVRLFKISPSEYWQQHYRFGKKSKEPVHDLGEASIHLLIINVVAPLLVAYGKAKDDWSLVDRAVRLLTDIPAEKNRITKLYDDLGYKCKSAIDSQGLIELYQNFCQRRQCLNCAIGASFLKSMVRA